MQKTPTIQSSTRMEEAPSSQEALYSEQYVPGVMPPTLGTLDMTVTFVAAIFYISNSTTAVGAGPAAFTYWIVCGLAFFLPCVIATAQLGVLFPYEGSLYIWTHRALGGFWSFFTGFCSWFPGVLAIVSGFGTAVSYVQNLKAGWLVEPWQQGLVVIFLIAFTTVLALQRFRTVQNVLNMVMGLVLLAVLLIGFAAAVWLLTGHPSATSFRQPGDWSINPGNFFLFGFLVQSFLGTEVPLNMAGEMVSKRSQNIIKDHLLWGALLVFLGYIVTTFAALVVQGQSGASTSYSFVTLVGRVFGAIPGGITAICLLSFFVVGPIVYNYAFARLLMVASIDRRLPIGLAKLNKHRVPVNAILFQSIVAVVFTVLIYFFIPYVFAVGHAADLSNEVFNISLAALTLVWLISIPFFFIDVLVVFFRDPQAFHKKRIVPMWVIWGSAFLGIATCLLAIVDTILNSWIPTQVSNASWWYIVGGLTLTCLILAVIGSLFATSEAAWQHWES